MGVAIYSSKNELLVPGRIRQDPAEGAGNGAAAMRTSEQTGPTSGRRQEEDPAAVAECNGALLMVEQTELTSRHPRHSRSSHSSGPPAKQPWTFGGIILAVAQEAVAAKHDEVQVLFERVESAPMARFHEIGQVFPDARYGHIVVTFDVALLRQEIKELQQGIAHRRQRAPPEHRGLYDVLEEHLVAGN
jgi:hypothetical protein